MIQHQALVAVVFTTMRRRQDHVCEGEIQRDCSTPNTARGSLNILRPRHAARRFAEGSEGARHTRARGRAPQVAILATRLLRAPIRSRESVQELSHSKAKRRISADLCADGGAQDYSTEARESVRRRIPTTQLRLRLCNWTEHRGERQGSRKADVGSQRGPQRLLSLDHVPTSAGLISK